MYKSFFNLTRNPFDISPDPSCFVPTPRHNEALAALYHGVRRHKGFVVVTGEVGTGKTLLLHCLIKLLKGSRDISYAYVFNGRLSTTEFLQYVLADFGLRVAGKSKCELLLDLGRFLVSRAERKMTTVLIVDEAHHLSADILEEIRLLSNLETSSDKLLQILLVGQPELDQMLDSHSLRQLKQRVTVRTSLSALSLEETKGYIDWRLEVAGCSGRETPIFEPEAVARIHKYAKGIPRVINTVCENSLIAAFANASQTVTAEIVDGVAEEFRLSQESNAGPVAHTIGAPSESEIHRAMNILLNWYAGRQGSVTAVEPFGLQEFAKESTHEPNF